MPGIARDGDTTGCGAALKSGASKTRANGRLVVRLGDGSDHGGTVISASGKVTAEGQPVARLGDLHSCPIPGHGVTPIVTASEDRFAG
jgi:uncharacterized Zn-binding protein involved in type VI secretion